MKTTKTAKAAARPTDRPTRKPAKRATPVPRTKKEKAATLDRSSTDTAQIFDERNRSVPWLIRDVHRLYKMQLQPIVSREGVTIGHWYYLRVLSESDGLSQRELSQRVGIASTTAVPAIDDMEAKGLVQRVRDTQDRRKIGVHLTPKGRRMRDEIMPEVINLLHRSVAGVSSNDMKVFLKVLGQLKENLLGELPEAKNVIG